MDTGVHSNQKDLWEVTIDSAKITLKLLSMFQNENHQVIHDALPALRALVEFGLLHDNTIDANIQQPNEQQSTEQHPTEQHPTEQQPLEQQPAEQQSIQNQTKEQPSGPQRSHRRTSHVDSNWDIVSAKEVKIKLHGDPNNVVIARAVTNEKELDILIRKIYKSEVVALDCEFMTSKKKPPLLKVLQFAVSESEGYAVIIQKVGYELLATKLKPVLEDSTVNYVSWAFKGDALAIEAAIRGIQIAPVLDLQSKLKPIAIEQLNLFSGMTKYAPDWEGLEEFQKAKSLGDHFVYYEESCIWLNDPLPPMALVYSIFDVVSLIVLAKSTTHFKTTKNNFWPLTLKEDSIKAQERYQRQRSVAASSPQPHLSANLITANTHTHHHQSTKSTYRNQSASPQVTNRNVTDESSLENPNKHSVQKSPSFKSTTTEHEDTTTVINYNDIMDKPHTVSKNEVEGDVYFSPWGEFSKKEHSSYLATSTPPVNNASLPPRSSLKSPVVTHQNIPSPQLSPRKNEKAPATRTITTSASTTATNTTTTTTTATTSTSTSTTTSTLTPTPKSASILATSFDSKPKDIGGMNIPAIAGEQVVTFTSEDKVPGAPEITAWKAFSDYSHQEWGKKHDVGIDAFDGMKGSKSPNFQSTTEKQTALSGSKSNSNTPDKKESEWDKDDERPSYMQINLNQHPVKKVFTGPKTVNPNDFEDDSDDSDDDDDDGEYGARPAKGYLSTKNSSASSSQAKSNTPKVGSFENKWQEIHNQNTSRSPQLSQQPQPTQSNYSQHGKQPLNKNNGLPASTYSRSPILSNEPYHKDNGMQETDVEDLSIYQDSVYLYSGETIKICRISEPSELNQVILPPPRQTFTVAVTFHYISPNTNTRRLKGLQVFLPDGDSYVIVVEQACFNTEITVNSKIATLLTHPRINRIAWYPEKVSNDVKQILGVTLGRTVDVGKKANSVGKPLGQDLQSSLDYYLKDWPTLEQYSASKEKYDNSVGKKFSNLWDREKLPVTVLEYSALEGASLYNLYQHPDLKAVSDQPYVFDDH